MLSAGGAGSRLVVRSVVIALCAATTAISASASERVSPPAASDRSSAHAQGLDVFLHSAQGRPVRRPRKWTPYARVPRLGTGVSFQDLAWSSWGGRRARATGTARGCFDGGGGTECWQDTNVTLTLSRSVRVEGFNAYYCRMKVGRLDASIGVGTTLVGNPSYGLQPCGETAP